MKSRQSIFLAIVIAALLMGTGCSQTGADSSFACRNCNVILISIDTLRADHLGVYGYHRNITPSIDRLASGAVLFENAYSQAPETSPSHMSMLTSLYPGDHGICDLTGGPGCDPFPVDGEKMVTLAEILHDHGYSAVGYTGGGQVHSELGFSQGFEVYEDGFDLMDFASLDDPFSSLPRSSPSSFFLFLHTYKTHDPYFPAEETARQLCGPYGGRVISSFEKLNEEGFRRALADPSSAFSQRFIQHLRKLFSSSQDSPLGERIPSIEELRGLLAQEPSGPVLARTVDILREEALGDASLVPFDLYAQIVFTKEDYETEDIDYLICLYDAEILEMDLALGRLLASLDRNNLTRDTLIIFTSDHGEEFLEHGAFGHQWPNEEIIRIPLIIANPPSAAEGVRIATRVRSIDILPTVLESLGISTPDEIRGGSLVPLLTAEGSPRRVFSELDGQAYSVVEGDFKLTWLLPDYTKVLDAKTSGAEVILESPSLHLYNLGTDPAEQVDIAESESATLERLSGLLSDHLQDERAYQDFERRIFDHQYSEELRSQLESLGYLG